MTASSINLLPKKFIMIVATLMLALGVTATQVSDAQAGHRDGRYIAGAVAGVALLAIIASQNRRHRRHHYHNRHRFADHGYHIHHNRWGRPYRCYKRHGRRHYRRRNHW